MFHLALKRSVWRLTALSTMLVLAGCGSDDSNSSNQSNPVTPAHSGTKITLGRLVITNSDASAPKAYIYDLDDKKVTSDVALKYLPTSMYSSPDYRYAVLVARADNITKFIDGGVN